MINVHNELRFVTAFERLVDAIEKAVDKIPNQQIQPTMIITNPQEPNQNKKEEN